MADLVGLPEVEAARQRLAGSILQTPLVSAPAFSEELRAEIALKCENLQQGAVFKVRGATNFVGQLAPEALKKGVVTFSAGNHGLAVALAARTRRTRARVVMPVWARKVKVEMVRQAGGEVEQTGETSLDVKRAAETLAEAEGFTLVPPFDHPAIIAGAGTVGLEIVEDWPEVEAVLVPVGGGGLIAGVAAAIKAHRPGCRVIGVEPTGAASMYESLKAGQPVTLLKSETIADGLVPVRPGELCFEHVVHYVERIVLVSDEAIREATLWLLETMKLVVEPSGAATVAALRARAYDPQGRRTVAVLSGGNISLEELINLTT